MRFLRADKLFDGENFVSNGSIVVLDDQHRFIDLINDNEFDKSKVEYFDGIICPGFVNPHCHLELSHLINQIPKHTGLPQFAQKIISQRSNFDESIALEHMQQWDKIMFKNGVVAVGDISNNDLSFKIKQNSNIYYHTFIELIGLNPQFANKIFENGLSLYNNLITKQLNGSIVPHAPYSVSKELLNLIANFNYQKKLSTSIHNQESMEELHFLMGDKSGFDELYNFLKIDLSWYNAPKESSIHHLMPIIKNKNWILVHNTFTSKEEIDLASSNQLFWCFCPKANLFIENKLPNFDYFKEQLNQICIGTDSLASNDDLDMISEMNVIKKHAHFNDENILQAATHNGAKALGIEENFGRFIPHKNAGLNLIRIEKNQFNFIKKIA